MIVGGHDIDGGYGKTGQVSAALPFQDDDRVGKPGLLEQSIQTIKRDEIMSAQQPVTSGNLFWQRAMQTVYNKSMQQLMVEQKNAWTTMRDERPLVTLKNNWTPTMTWKDDALFFACSSRKRVAEPPPDQGPDLLFPGCGCGRKVWVHRTKNGVVGYVLGPNLQFTLPFVTFDSSTKPTDVANRKDMFWEGEQWTGLQPTDVYRGVTDQLLQVKNNQLHLSRMVDWQLNNLNVPFEKLVGTSKRTVMVYSDVVESTVVGVASFPRCGKCNY